MRRAPLTASTLLLALLVAACPAVPDDGTSTSPPPATANEVRLFCEAWSEVHASGGLGLPESLIEVAPAEIKDVVIRMSGPQGDGWEEDLRRFNEFISQCET
ncbi:MAG: hypothetical protein R3258_03850 [Acidimicrobiia bacterium]|nr:hypothetical protein [Acidimicrobiia bacterium]